MHVFYTPDIATHVEMPEEEVGHCLRVLRLTTGDEVTLTDGKGNFYKAVISAATNKRCQLKVVETIPQEKGWTGWLHVAMAPTKNMDRTEWFAEKATEIGFDELTFLNCRYSERKIIKTERFDKILISAMKQSNQMYLPVLNEPIKLTDFLSKEISGQKFIAHCEETEKVELKDRIDTQQNYTLLIGPEGDFSTNEINKALKNGYLPVALGSTRLRTETAALVGCHTFVLANN